MGNALVLDDVVRADFVAATRQYLRAVEQRFDVRIARVAIDAPRLPSVNGRRASELAMDRLGISCIPTPSVQALTLIRHRVAAHLAAGGAHSCLPSANQLWMFVGFDLFSGLSAELQCIEVFPNAIVHAIARGAPHKATAAGFEAQLGAFERASGWTRDQLPSAGYGTRHDRLDSLMSAWIASLPDADRIGHGDGADDTMWSVRYPFAGGV
jgi:hypothetical protein